MTGALKLCYTHPHDKQLTEIMVNEKYQQQKQAVLTFSKKQVRKAGEAIRKGCSREQQQAAIAVIRSFRESHLYPLMLIKNHVNRMAKKVTDDYILARRLKRLPTILDKLTRPTLDGEQANAIALTRMQDIGGCRIILDNVEQVYQLLHYLKKSRSVHKIIRVQDTLFEPKDSGYRGIHVVFSCFEHADVPNNPWFKHKIELQIRTRLQHAWATCIETMDIFEHTQLKTRTEGDTAYRVFFKLAAQLMAEQERGGFLSATDFQQIQHDFIQKELTLDVSGRLIGYSLASRNVGYQGKGKKLDGQMLIALGKNKQGELVNTVRYFAKSKDAEAIAQYNRLEDDELQAVVVLVAVKNLMDVQKAYPNYYADTSLFLEFIAKHKNQLLSKLL